MNTQTMPGYDARFDYAACKLSIVEQLLADGIEANKAEKPIDTADKLARAMLIFSDAMLELERLTGVPLTAMMSMYEE